MKRTATISREYIYGTRYPSLNLRYRGFHVRFRESGGTTGYYMIQDDGLEAVEAMKRAARAHDFTHVRFTGDWSNRTKPKGGKL